MPNSLEWHLYWFLSCMLHLSTYDIYIASFIIMVSVNLDTKPHPRPYRLQWLSEDEEVKVTQQVEVCPPLEDTMIG